MRSISLFSRQMPESLKSAWLKILVIFAFLCFRSLLDFNMGGGGWNEIDVLPLARQYADPNWIPNDWYLNQFASYRFLFQIIFGSMAATWGFLATSIIGRLICYALVATGLGLLGQKLGLSLPALLAAVALFVMINSGRDFRGSEQGAIAFEWIVGGLEAKALAYGFLLPAIWLLLEGQYHWMALLLGVATSFHVLVGGWAFLVVLGWLLLNRDRLASLRQLLAIGLIYLVGSAFAIIPVIQQFLQPAIDAEIQPSFIYVFLRLPHHLDPLSWKPEFWIRPIVYLLVLLVCTVLIRRWYKAGSLMRFSAEQQQAAIGLVLLTLIALVPFVLGVAIAPFDSQGQLLQYYPFRLGDVLLPLTTFLMLAYTLEHLPVPNGRRIAQFIFIAVIGVALLLQSVLFQRQVTQLLNFPSPKLEGDVDWQPWTRMSRWIQNNTPQDAVIISPPEEIESFTWFTERATVAKYKMFPQTKANIIEWYERMQDLSGDTNLWKETSRTNDDDAVDIRDRLTNGYNNLTTDQVRALLDKYQADYFLTRSNHRLDLPIAHRNAAYVLYGR
ncbi:MAG: hypothetical protein Kow00121_08340 [Elainellaceae cyanobacterium]